MRAQAKLGIDISTEVIAAYESVKTKIDLGSIERREAELKHDVKARIEEFNALAGHQRIHLGLTSRDVTENIEGWQIKKLCFGCAAKRCTEDDPYLTPARMGAL